MNHLSLMLEAVGPKSRDYYADKFAHFSQSGIPSIDWNAAGLLGFAWFFYRKIWALVVPGAALLIAAHFVPGSLGVSIIVLLSTSALGSLFGNQIYYMWVRWLLAHGEKLGYKGEDALREFLRREGGTADTPLRL